MFTHLEVDLEFMSCKPIYETVNDFINFSVLTYFYPKETRFIFHSFFKRVQLF